MVNCSQPSTIKRVLSVFPVNSSIVNIMNILPKSADWSLSLPGFGDLDTAFEASRSFRFNILKVDKLRKY